MTYGLQVIDDQGEAVIDAEITPDTALQIAGILLKAKAPEPTPMAAAVEEEEPVRRKGRPRGKRGGKRPPCDYCGSVGPRHRKTCIKNGPAPEMPSKSEPLTEEQFDRIKEAVADGSMVSSELAAEMDVKLREVNLAIFADTYEDYLSERAHN